MLADGSSGQGPPLIPWWGGPTSHNPIYLGSVADPYPGSGAFLTPGSGFGMKKYPEPGSGILVFEN